MVFSQILCDLFERVRNEYLWVLKQIFKLKIKQLAFRSEQDIRRTFFNLLNISSGVGICANNANSVLLSLNCTRIKFYERNENISFWFISTKNWHLSYKSAISIKNRIAFSNAFIQIFNDWKIPLQKTCKFIFPNSNVNQISISLYLNK